jgi:DNA-binding beta-propeller fold protein YncE
MSLRHRFLFLPSIFGVTCGLAAALAATPSPRGGPLPAGIAVGRQDANRHALPTGQLITPAGTQVDLPGMRPQALALSPDGRTLATSGRTRELLLLDAATGAVRQRLHLVNHAAAEAPAPETTNLLASGEAKLSLAGLRFSADGRRLFFSNANGNVLVFAFDAAAQTATLAQSFALPAAGALARKAEVPAGLALSADGRRLYVAANLGNQLHELDAATGDVLRSWAVGVAPGEVALAQGKAYVSNRGGRRPDAGDVTGPAGKGTVVRADARGIASEGSVTVVDLAAGRVQKEILVGLHPAALAASPDGRWVVVANAGSDTLHVIDARRDEIAEKIWARQKPSDLFGAQPCALAFDPSGKRLFVCNATQNAVAVVQFDPADKESQVAGLIPVGWFPAGIVYDRARDRLCMSNLKGIGAWREFAAGEPVKLATKDFWGTLSLVPVPAKKELAAHTATALANMRYPLLAKAARPARADAPARPVPERVGEPSVFKHVIYVIKENRTYDQMLGDMPEGDGDPALCTFGEKFTPNQHRLAREFILLDNTYCSGVQSSDGHQWTDAGIVNEYTERQLIAANPRSYPSAKDEIGADALVYASSGHLWDHALARGLSVRNFGEWMISDSGWKDAARKPKPAWLDYLRDHEAGIGLLKIASHAAIPSLRAISKTDTVGWDLAIPDQVRATKFIDELRQAEATGEWPALMILFLPNDHTGGTTPGRATPGAMVADNDLAFGRIVEAVSRSRFWPQTCIIAIEDDPQNGWDHVSGYRTTCYVVSPYTKRRQTIRTQYNQTSVLRTIGLMLGVPPMNQLDATATPMGDCFQATPDFAPYAAVPSQVPLDTLNPEAKKVADALLRKHALASARLPLDRPDLCEEGELNEILWHAMKGSAAPFPHWAVKLAADED